MVDVSVCVGSSCHLKGSYPVIRRLQELIADHDLEGRVKLSGSFCLSCCGNGVTVRINDTCYKAAGVEEADALFMQHIQPLTEV